MDQIELDVAAAADQLMVAVRLGPLLTHTAADDARIDVEESLPYITHEREVGFGVAAGVVVEEDPSGAARFLSVRQVEITIAPGFEIRIVARIVAFAGRAERGVEISCVLLPARCPGA